MAGSGVLGSRLAADGHFGAAVGLLVVAGPVGHRLPGRHVRRRELGKALHVGWLATLGSDEAWFAFAVWVVVFVAMLGSFLAGSLRNPVRAQADAVGGSDDGRSQ